MTQTKTPPTNPGDSDIIVTAYTVKRGRELVFSEVNISEENSGKLLTNGTMIYRIT